MTAGGWRRVLGLRALLWAVALGGACAYGVLIHRHHYPPFETFQSLYRYGLARAALAERARSDGGTWYPIDDTPVDNRDARSRVASLPYAQGYQPAPLAAGVRHHAAGLAQDGLTLVVSAHGPEAQMLALDGRVVHTWRRTVQEVWPGYRETVADLQFGLAPGATYWRNAQVLPDGGIIALFDEIGLARLDVNSRVVWTITCECHHDFDVARDGTVFALEHLPDVFEGQPVLQDRVLVIGPDGRLQRTLALKEGLLASEYSSVLWRGLDHVRANGTWDLLHVNAIRLDPDAGDRPRALISFPTTDTVGILDLTDGRVTWALSNLWTFQHDPQWLPEGRLLLFDNRRGRSPYGSRVVEIERASQRVVWTFPSAPTREFYTPIAGTVQRLPNGNTLITQSAAGRVLEVTADGRIAWEFVNPRKTGPQGTLIAVIYRAQRFTAADLPPLPAAPAR